MRLWNSAEAEHTVGHAYSTIANEIEKIVNSYIEDTHSFLMHMKTGAGPTLRS